MVNIFGTGGGSSGGSGGGVTTINYNVEGSDAPGQLRLIARGGDTTGYLPAQFSVFQREARPILSAMNPAPVSGQIDSLQASNIGLTTANNIPISSMEFFKGKFIAVASGSGNPVYSTPSLVNGPWDRVATQFVSAFSGDLIARGDDEILFCRTSTTAGWISSDGLNRSVISNFSSIQGGTNDAIYGVFRNPDNDGQFVVAVRDNANNAPVLAVHTNFSAQATRINMAPSSGYVEGFVKWPEAGLFVCTMTDGSIQTAPALAGPWTVRPTGKNSAFKSPLIVNGSLYAFGSNGELLSADFNSPFVYSFSYFDDAMSTVNDAKKIGDTVIIVGTPRTGSNDARGRIIVSTDMVNFEAMSFVNGGYPSNPKSIVTDGNIVAFVDTSSPFPIFSQALDIDFNTEFTLPSIPSNTPAASWYFRDEIDSQGE